MVKFEDKGTKFIQPCYVAVAQTAIAGNSLYCYVIRATT
jgi:hypothetical protein